MHLATKVVLLVVNRHPKKSKTAKGRENPDRSSKAGDMNGVDKRPRGCNGAETQALSKIIRAVEE